MATVWERWGFSKNPFANHALEANQEGFELLSGRELELEELTYYLENSSLWIPVSGNAGVGKTSLANVASYVLYQNSKKAEPPCALFIPCESPISVNPKESNDDFKDRVARVVLRSLIKYSFDIKNNHKYSIDNALFEELDRLKAWISEPITGGKGAGVAGISLSKTTSANTSSGYSKSFSDQVLSLTEGLFSTGGGVVCIIDNCEVYPDAVALVNVLSALRDDLFLKKGLKWVFCGALGILERITDDRLANFLSDNVVEVNPISAKSDVAEMINRRRKVFGKNNKTDLPIENTQIDELFNISGGNPRMVLAKAEGYCLWAGRKYKSTSLAGNSQPTAALFDQWRNEQINKFVSDFAPLLNRKAWKVFIKLDQIGGDVRPYGYSQFECNSVPAFLQHIQVLIQHGLVAKFHDQDDLRGTIYRITDKGRWTMYAWKLKSRY